MNASSSFRPDIQALRALAVSLVLIYHLWPTRLTGGFIGVDIFFVISGFLITSHLLGKPPRSGRDLATFWSRRIRRLLPASLTVLGATAVAVRLVAPETQWASTAREIVASALYVQNWQLARTSVDYLAAENAPSPVQHFWSLSVEEQFYLAWPVLILVLVMIARRRGWDPTTVVTGGVALVAASSFAFSVWATAKEPASAYFITPTRIWELGAGAVLAGLAVRRSSRPVGRRAQPTGSARHEHLRSLLAWVGLLAILFSAFELTAQDPFPGWRAAIPVLGAAAVIAARNPGGRWSPRSLVTRRPVQFVGDISYSVYLWHWPLIVLVPYISGGQLGLIDKLAIVVVTLLAAWWTKVYIEDRFRFARPATPLRRPFQLAAVAMAIVVGLGVLQVGEAAYRGDQARDQLRAALAGNAKCFGAAALATPEACKGRPAGPAIPAPAEAVDDRPAAYQRDCFEPAPFEGLRRCVFGDPRGKVSVALVGNSHAGHWLPALQEVAARENWKVTTYMASECAVTKAPVEWDAADKESGCLGWADRVMKKTASGDFDLVVTASRNGRPAKGQSYDDSYPAWSKGYRSVVDYWKRKDVNVLTIHDTATPGATLKSVPDCIAGNEDDLAKCGGPRREWVPRDPLFEAVQDARVPRMSTVDLNDYLCGTSTCPAVVGGVTVYFDASHMTKTFSRTLAPYLEPALLKALGRP